MTAPDDPDRLLAVLRDAVDLSGERALHVVVHAADPRHAGVLQALVGDGPGRVTVMAGTGADLADLRSVVLEHGADLGAEIAGDLVRLVDEHGERVPPSTVLTVVGLRVASAELAAGRVPLVLHDELCSRAVPDLLEAAGAATSPVSAAELVEQAVGRGAVLGGDADGRFVARDTGSGTTGLFGLVHVLAELAGQVHPLSVLAELYQPYVGAGPVEVVVPDADEAVARVLEAYVTTPGGGPVQADQRDGLLVSHWDAPPPWWFAVRHRDGRLELTVEAADEDVLDKVRDDVLSLLRTGENR